MMQLNLDFCALLTDASDNLPFHEVHGHFCS